MLLVTSRYGNWNYAIGQHHNSYMLEGMGYKHGTTKHQETGFQTTQCQQSIFAKRQNLIPIEGLIV